MQQLSQTFLWKTLTATSLVYLAWSTGWCSSVMASFKDNPKVIVDEAWQIVNREYVDGTFNRQNWQTIRQELLNRNYSSKIEAYTAIKNALEKLDDPYTRFMEPVQFQALTKQTSGESSGIGLKLEISQDNRQLIVAEALADSPASKAGIMPGDTVLAIDGKSTQNISLDEAITLIRGDIGSSINLRISRIGKGVFEVPLKRMPLEVASVFSTVKRENNINVGYIRLTEFNAHSTTQMERAIKELNSQRVQGFVLDLRGNPGGLLQSSIEIARLWMNEGVIVKTVDRQGSNENFRANNTAISNAPLIVLLDGNSASASEILAGALKDNNRAVIVGSQSFGKALVQSVHSLSDGSGIAVTIAHYYTPNGTDIGHKGITPDIKVDLNWLDQGNLTENPEQRGSANDRQYQRAIFVLQSSVTNKPTSLSSN